jgi:tetratricopeptide (TPR) repeat protein
MFRHAADVDPFHLDHNTGLGFALLNLGLLDESVRQFRKVLDLEPGWSLARFWLAETLAVQGRRDEAVAEYLGFLGASLAPEQAAGVTENLRGTYQERGWTAFWRAELALAEEDAASSGSVWGFPARTRQPYPIARRHARLGDTARALAALERACEGRDYAAVFLAIDPAFVALRHESRFQALVRRIGVPPSASR